MDYRCLYGHRIPTDFSYAIQQNACPRCGAPMVTVVGYQLARNLAAHVPLDAVDAFNTARYLEANYTLEARQEPVPPEVAVGEVGEVEIDEAEVEHTETGAAVIEDDEERPTTLDAPPAPALVQEPVQAAPKAAGVMPVAPVSKTQVEAQQELGADAAVEQSDLTELERNFFAEG